MSLFPRFSSHNDASMHPLFRLLEDPAVHQSLSSSRGTSSSHRQVFQPNFDVHETAEAYILDGELPGVSDKSNIDIEFVDSQTLVVKGRVERSYQSGNNAPPTESTSSSAEKKPLNPTVEEAAEDETSNTTVATTKKEVAAGSNSGQPKFWVSERVVGEFQRSFSFPHGIDQDAVKASLNHGVLNIVIPKRTQKGSRKIVVE